MQLFSLFLPKQSLLLLFLVLGFALSLPAFALPTLGQGNGYTISLHEERDLGQVWLRQFRSQARLHQDPLIQDYLEHLTQDIAAHNPNLDTSHLTLLLLDQSQLNAFAVPGGIIGVNTGLFLFTRQEDELAAVLAHELAHLSQRHFARRVQSSQNLQWSTMAGLLAGILVASQGHADAGIAAILSTQAASIQNQLAWSRSHEQEADRIGMETLVAAGYAPEAMPSMLQQMQRLSGLQGSAPEFLRTHPLTASRLADAWSRADQLAPNQPALNQQKPKHKRIIGRDYELLRIRLIFHHEARPLEALRFFLQTPTKATGRAYAQLLVEQKQGDQKAALTALKQLHEQHPDWLLLHFLLAEALVKAKAWEQALVELDALLAWTPSYYPGIYLLAEFYMQTKNWFQAYELLQGLSRKRPQDPHIWMQLAEAAGKAEQHLGLHQARAEYFQLTGSFRQAITQLDLAIALAKQDNNWLLQEQLKARRQELKLYGDSQSFF